MKITRWGAAAAFGAAAVLVLATPAYATHGHSPAEPWTALDAIGPTYPFDREPAAHSTVESDTSVLLRADPANPGGTSVETPDLGLDVTGGEVVSFTYELLDGAVCGGGAPRVFLYDVPDADTMLDPPWVNSAGAAEPCGVDGVVTFEVPAGGRIGTAGVVYDSGAGGAVRVSNLTVDGKLVLFTQEREESGPSPTPVPTGSPAAEESPAPGTGGETLPSTSGVSLLPVLLAGGLALTALGGGLYAVARRRQPPTEAD